MPTENASLVFIPFPMTSHLLAAVKTANLIADRDDRLSVTVLVMNLPITDIDVTSIAKNPSYSRINFVELPANDSISPEMMKSPEAMILGLIENQKGAIKDEAAKIARSARLAGFVLDIFCGGMNELAKELGAPAYFFFTCGAASLGLTLQLQSLLDEQALEPSEYKDTDKEIIVPTYINAVPGKVWPSAVFDNKCGFLNLARKLREARGIIVNTFLEFESHAIWSLSSDKKIPTIYPVGPIIQDMGEVTDQGKEILDFLDGQPEKSVVYLCFGTNGSFDGDQVKEIAAALENSGLRFVWSLRKPPPKEQMGAPGEYENFGEVLPEGFLEHTNGKGKVIGWAPQMAVLSHPSVGGFVSHCGWNSILESVWFGVPMAVWPLMAEQQANAFQLVKDFEMAVEIKMDYREKSDVIVSRETIEKAIGDLMGPTNEIRVKVKEMKEKSRKVLTKGGSSHDFLGRLIDSVLDDTF